MGVGRVGDFWNGMIRKYGLLSPAKQHFLIFKIISFEGLVILSWEVDLTFGLPFYVFSF